jgi:predicted alpha/beta-hydrolase family hydrolase
VRAAQLRTVVERNSIDKWVQSQFADIEAKMAGGPAAAGGGSGGGRR